MGKVMSSLKKSLLWDRGYDISPSDEIGTCTYTACKPVTDNTELFPGNNKYFSPFNGKNENVPRLFQSKDQGERH
jgi:hypothetical protein